MAAGDNNALNDGMPVHHQIFLVLKLVPGPLVAKPKARVIRNFIVDLHLKFFLSCQGMWRM